MFIEPVNKVFNSLHRYKSVSPDKIIPDLVMKETASWASTDTKKKNIFISKPEKCGYTGS